MPIYEYQCTRCGHRVEQIQRLDDPPLTVCEECGGELKKMISAPAFQFKGTGWYVTDYAGKKGGETKETKSSGGSDAGKESSGESSKDAKAASAAGEASGSSSSSDAKGKGSDGAASSSSPSASGKSSSSD